MRTTPASRAWVPLAAAIGCLLGGLADAQTPPSQVGEWASVQTWPIVPIHLHLLPTGKVMLWPGDGGISGNDPRVWDPATDTVGTLARPGRDIFCSGHSFLADGRLLVTGGHIQNNVGLPSASIYDPITNAWTPLPAMNAGRWYPTNTTLANGDVLVVSGNIDSTQGINPLPQIWESASGGWRSLTTAQLKQPGYPFMHLGPNGGVFNSGPSQTTRTLDTSGTGTWRVVGNSSFGSRTYGSSVLYDEGTVVLVGGGDPPTNSVEVIDLNATTPAWRTVSPMVHPRRQHNATILPDGKVLVTGGSSGAGFNNATTPVYAAELWDPVTETWTTMASARSIRIYHSAALLLPDGRVLSAGGNGHPETEVFSPPYLFKGARPTIGAAPRRFTWRQAFYLQTASASAISQVTLVRLSSVTHAFNQNQRFNRLTFARVPGGLNVTAPGGATLAPPGHYLLFVLNGSAVPSVASIVRIGTAADAVPATPTNLTATAVGTTRIDLAWTDASSNETRFEVERSANGAAFQGVAHLAAGATRHTDTGLAVATRYTYRLRAVNDNGSSATSSTAQVTTGAGLPAAPSNLTATAVSSSRIDLAWTDNASNETGFRIERSRDGDDFDEVGTVGANVTAYAATDLAHNRNYWFRVRAYNATGSSARSNVARAKTRR